MNIESKILYKFKDKKLLEIALTHPSEEIHAHNNQRFEFLGDSILSTFISKYLFKYHPNANEGKLNLMRSSIVCGNNLSKKALELGMEDYIILSQSYKKKFKKPSSKILEDSFESLIAAIYLDSSTEITENWLKEIFYNDLTSVEAKIKKINPKGTLQEWAQLNSPGNLPQYRLVSESGPDHNKKYKVIVSIKNQNIGEGNSSSIKSAEINAAVDAIEKFL